VTDALIEKSVSIPLSPQAEEHLSGCNHCQEFVRVLNEPVPVNSPSPAILGEIEQRIVADLRPVRPLAPARYFFAAMVGIFISVVALVGYRMGAALSVGFMSPLQAGVILSALAAGAGSLAYSLVHQMAPGDRHRISPALLAAGIVISLAIAIVILFQFQDERNFWGNSWACLRAGLIIGVFAAVPFWLVLRRGAMLTPALTGAATGLLAGLVGTSVLEMHCPNLDAWHILVSHLGVAVLCSVAGLVAGLVTEIIGRRLAHRKVTKDAEPD
jgi:hypothetical protein